ncbi:hypothetical protein N7462_004337 [Penicillium macrosclerotiorum]|uniref:uncharacterized protein n=1 Tax=Penicillium macrosclerotiorum TaxID=303699 RepID=UPI0025495DF0|nr:uncharacterized protein N7462_004337 [Penicillium macrosclerotiorum]KAJ5689945.1 hypothetical protein N7462_004337 [Penicillium macrosclerotiorum]
MPRQFKAFLRRLRLRRCRLRAESDQHEDESDSEQAEFQASPPPSAAAESPQLPPAPGRAPPPPPPPVLVANAPPPIPEPPVTQPLISTTDLSRSVYVSPLPPIQELPELPIAPVPAPVPRTVVQVGLSSLPPELLHMIAPFLDNRSLYRLAVVCRGFYHFLTRSVRARTLNVGLTPPDDLRELYGYVNGRRPASVMQSWTRAWHNNSPNAGRMGEFLLEAANQGDDDVVWELLQHRVDPNSSNGLGLRPLIVAILHNLVAMVDVLLAFGANPNLPNTFRNETPMYEAARLRRHAIVSLLIRAGGDVNAQGGTPMAYLLQHGTQENIQLAIQFGADLMKANEALLNAMGLPVLHCIVDRDDPALLKMILPHLPDRLIHAVDQMSNATALHWAIKRRKMRVWEIIAQTPIGINQMDDYGETALTAARDGSHQDVVKWLLNNGAT